MDDGYKCVGLCDCFQDGQEMVIEDFAAVPHDFCSSAWADIRHGIVTVAMGANLSRIRQPGPVITGCRDWFRPVILKAERMDHA
jgi:uncharacterized repeat protein (TIGR04076 family)